MKNHTYNNQNTNSMICQNTDTSKKKTFAYITSIAFMLCMNSASSPSPLKPEHEARFRENLTRRGCAGLTEAEARSQDVFRELSLAQMRRINPKLNPELSEEINAVYLLPEYWYMKTLELQASLKREQAQEIQEIAKVITENIERMKAFTQALDAMKEKLTNQAQQLQQQIADNEANLQICCSCIQVLDNLDNLGLLSTFLDNLKAEWDKREQSCKAQARDNSATYLCSLILFGLSNQTCSKVSVDDYQQALNKCYHLKDKLQNLRARYNIPPEDILPEAPSTHSFPKVPRLWLKAPHSSSNARITPAQVMEWRQKCALTTPFPSTEDGARFLKALNLVSLEKAFVLNEKLDPVSSEYVHPMSLQWRCSKLDKQLRNDRERANKIDKLAINSMEDRCALDTEDLEKIKTVEGLKRQILELKQNIEATGVELVAALGKISNQLHHTALDNLLSVQARHARPANRTSFFPSTNSRTNATGASEEVLLQRLMSDDPVQTATPVTNAAGASEEVLLQRLMSDDPVQTATPESNVDGLVEVAPYEGAAQSVGGLPQATPSEESVPSSTLNTFLVPIRYRN